MDPATAASTVSTQFWESLADQVPGLVAFLVVMMIVVSQFIKANKEITKMLMENMKARDTQTTNAMEKISNSLEAMGNSIVARLDQHDKDVEPKVMSALERYNGQDRRQGEGRRATNGIHHDDQDQAPTPSRVVKHNSRSTDSQQEHSE